MSGPGETQFLPDPDRLAAGWERRFVVEARRAEEFVRLYESLGFEVCADAVRRDQIRGDCDDCRLALLLDYRAIYTRRR